MFKDILSAPNPASGVVLGVLIGETVGQGPYQHYNLVELRNIPGHRRISSQASTA